jgi:hypothetical protein
MWHREPWSEARQNANEGMVAILLGACAIARYAASEATIDANAVWQQKHRMAVPLGQTTRWSPQSTFGNSIEPKAPLRIIGNFVVRMPRTINQRSHNNNNNNNNSRIIKRQKRRTVLSRQRFSIETKTTSITAKARAINWLRGCGQT